MSPDLHQSKAALSSLDSGYGHNRLTLAGLPTRTTRMPRARSPSTTLSTAALVSAHASTVPMDRFRAVFGRIIGESMGGKDSPHGTLANSRSRSQGQSRRRLGGSQRVDQKAYPSSASISRAWHYFQLSHLMPLLQWKQGPASEPGVCASCQCRGGPATRSGSSPGAEGKQ